MTYLCQLWVFDRGTPDIDVRFVISRDPLKNAPSKPTRIVEWDDEDTHYYVAYWHLPEAGMTDDLLKKFVHSKNY